MRVTQCWCVNVTSKRWSLDRRKTDGALRVLTDRGGTKNRTKIYVDNVLTDTTTLDWQCSLLTQLEVNTYRERSRKYLSLISKQEVSEGVSWEWFGEGGSASHCDVQRPSHRDVEMRYATLHQSYVLIETETKTG